MAILDERHVCGFLMAEEGERERLPLHVPAMVPRKATGAAVLEPRDKPCRDPVAPAVAHLAPSQHLSFPLWQSSGQVRRRTSYLAECRLSNRRTRTSSWSLTSFFTETSLSVDRDSWWSLSTAGRTRGHPRASTSSVRRTGELSLCASGRARRCHRKRRV